jgi:phage terminase large subunit-like protein
MESVVKNILEVTNNDVWFASKSLYSEGFTSRAPTAGCVL